MSPCPVTEPCVLYRVTVFCAVSQCSHRVLCPVPCPVSCAVSWCQQPPRCLIAAVVPGPGLWASVAGDAVAAPRESVGLDFPLLYMATVSGRVSGAGRIGQRASRCAPPHTGRESGTAGADLEVFSCGPPAEVKGAPCRRAGECRRVRRAGAGTAVSMQSSVWLRSLLMNPVEMTSLGTTR